MMLASFAAVIIGCTQADVSKLTEPPFLIDGQLLRAFEIAWKDVLKGPWTPIAKKLDTYHVKFSKSDGLIVVTFTPARGELLQGDPKHLWDMGVWVSEYVDLKKSRVTKSVIDDE